MSVDLSVPSTPKQQFSTPDVGSALRVKSLSVENFRLLKGTGLALAPVSTVLVGRNNSGKTSLAEVMVRFLHPNGCRFAIADFSSESYSKFHEAYQQFKTGDDLAARDLLPEITLTVDIDYDSDLPEFGPLSAIIVDLDPACHEARLKFSYSLAGGQLAALFDGLENLTDGGTRPDLTTVIRHVGDRLPKLYDRQITAVDPGDPSNTRTVTLETVRKLITVDFLHAQRGLDDDKDKPKDLISNIFQSLFTAATGAAADTSQRKTVEQLTEAIVDIETALGEKVETVMASVVPALEQFGYPGLNGQSLATRTKLDVERLLANHTSVHYESVAGVTLPESYSGLGSRNLVLILLTLLSFYRAHASRGSTPGLHLVFIEEPEAHLHPQMQEVFIDQLNNLCTIFPRIDQSNERWCPQFVVSTHSSHVANKAAFSSIRYFLVEASSSGVSGRRTEILDLSSAHGIDEKFLHQYLTLTRSDLFFADKAILVEGTSERLMVPKSIEKTANRLASQYITIMEVGGAYAHLFFPLLDFLKIPSLIITDIDSVAKKDGDKRWTASCVHDGGRTSNATIKEWFEGSAMTPLQLVAAAGNHEIVRPNRYLAYQIPETDGGACGRSFEEAFILANPELFDFTLGPDNAATERASTEKSKEFKKSDFALKYAVKQQVWETPRYIRQGLDWLLDIPIGNSTATPDANEGPVVVK